MPKYKFQKSDFNPVLICLNIVILSTGYYLTNIFFTILFNSIFKTKLHINQIISDEALDLSSKYGYSFLCSSFFTNMVMVVLFVVVVEKAKKILDYVLTNFFIHLVLCTVNSGFPFRFLWWTFNGLIITIVTLLSEYITLKIEQKEIKLDFSLGKSKKK